MKKATTEAMKLERRRRIDSVSKPGLKQRNRFDSVQGLQRWIWLDPVKHPDLQRCEARRIQGGGLPVGQRGFAVVEFRGRVALPSPAAGPLHLRVSADTAYRLRLNGTDLAAGPAPAPGDWLPLPRLAVWYADALEAPAAPVLDFDATVRLGEARLCETSAGHGGFFLAGEVALADGSTFRFTADESWQVRVLPAWRGPESFDGSLPPGPWEAPVAVEDIWHAQVATIPVREERMAEETALDAPAGGEAQAVADWARVRAGYVRLRADGPCEAEAAPFETDPAKPHARFRARFGESGGEALSPLHSVGGLALSLRAGERPVHLRAELIETHLPEDPATTGSFRCSDPGLTKVWEIARDTLRACRQNLHLDSPKHQEMLACAGDYHVESLMEQACFGDLRLAAHDLRGVARMLEATDGRLFHTSYGLIWALWLRDVWRLTGDRALVRDCLPALERLLRRFETYRGPSGLLENPPDWMFLDWLVVEGRSLHHPPRALGQTALNGWYAGALDAAMELRSIGQDGACPSGLDGACPSGLDGACPSGLDGAATALRRAARTTLFDADAGLWLDGLDTPDPGEPPWRPANPRGLRRHGAHANILAALFGLSEGDEARAILRRALSDELGPIQPWFAHWALEAAAKLGLFGELGMPLLRRWIPSVEACEKGLAEGWHAPEPGYAFDHSHAWGGTPAWQLPVRLLGLRIEEPGFRRISLAPDLFGLDWADINLPTPFGPIRARLCAGREPTLEIPDGVAALVRGSEIC